MVLIGAVGGGRDREGLLGFGRYGFRVGFWRLLALVILICVTLSCACEVNGCVLRTDHGRELGNLVLGEFLLEEGEEDFNGCAFLRFGACCVGEVLGLPGIELEEASRGGVKENRFC